jgi:hypothetical protein
MPMKMRRRGTATGIAALILALCMFADGVRAQVLVWSMGNSQTNTQNIANWLMTTASFPSITAYDGTGLTLTDLMNYQAVLFFSNSAGDPTTVGNVLADYADTGRRLVLATFSWANQGGNTLGGRIITAGISPFVVAGSTLYSNATMASNDGSALFAGVNTITGHYRDSVSTTAGTVVNALWSDGHPFVATRGNVVGITLYADDASGNVSGDYRQLFANALLIPEPSTQLYLAVGMIVIVAAGVRRRRKV